MSNREVMQQALDALVQLDGLDTETECVTIDVGDVIAVLKAALEQQAEPPPEWPLIKNILAVFGLDAISFVAKWQAAQRQWVGLEIEEVQDSYNSDYQAQTRAVEKLLKERNT